MLLLLVLRAMIMDLTEVAVAVGFYLALTGILFRVGHLLPR